MTSVKLNESLLHMDVLCVSRYREYTLAGIGSTLFVYSDKALLLSLPIFIDERIHSLRVRNNLILLKGGRQLTLVKVKETSDEFECHVISKIQSPDWVQDVIMFENQLAGLVTAHNFFECWDLKTKKQLNVSSCEEKSLAAPSLVTLYLREDSSQRPFVRLKVTGHQWYWSYEHGEGVERFDSYMVPSMKTANHKYSCKIIGDGLDNLVIFAGTAFGDVLIWTPFFKENPTLKRFKAHNGIVFSIEAEPRMKVLTTTSDDRSLKIWSVTSHQFILHPDDWKNSTIQLVYNLFGHTARVWKSMILPNYYLTIGEDSKIVVWSRDGRMIKALSLHQESGIRALDYSPETDVIITGGEDGGINAFSLNHLVAEDEALKMFDLGQSFSAKVCFTEKGFLYVVNGSCVLVSDANEELIYKSDNFSSYCVLEASTESEFIMMGSIKGLLVVLDLNRKAVLIEKQVLNGRIYSIHSVGQFIMICGPEGRLYLWELANGTLKNAGTMTLPNCKERWTTCGTFHNEKLFIGDRMGNLHIYELHGGENPVKSFRKFHGYLGVTDVTVFEDICFSVGRDGTIKRVTDDLAHLNTCKLPLEWPWKIVKYKDDILILGFRGVSFVVWSTKEREIIASHDCKGGHRSCDYKLLKNKLRFLYVKERKVLVVDLTLDGVTRIKNGFHGKEINCLKILQSRPTVIMTGSEDTTLRISIIEKSEVKQIEVLQTHISSVRAICSLSLTETTVIIVSVGGKGQLVVWNLNLRTLKCHELVNHCLKKETQNWKSPNLIMDPHTRIMCVDLLKHKNEILIFIGCSDCQIRIFSYNGVLSQLCTIPYTHCVLNLGVLTVDLMRVLVSMGTDGKVVFWEVTDCCNAKQLETFSLHQLGINAFQFEEIDRGKFILATGGDDNLVSVAFVEVLEGKINLRQVWRSNTTHSCQITGIKILKSLLITTSTDQRITVWEWIWQKNEFKAKFLNQYMTAVPDVQGMDAVWHENSTVLVTVYGKGMEIIQMNVNSLDQQKS